MNLDEMNMTEAQLRSWRPRRPSARLERQLFGRPTTTHGSRWLWSSLIPATACAILTLLASGTNPMESVGHQGLISASLSNYNSAAYASGSQAEVQNHLATITFDCTNRGITYSSVGFAPSTNFTN